MGLWDVVAAMRFISKNIAQFGGDPSKITLFGESPGAMVVQLLLMTPHGSGLFRAAILQSGPILSAFAHMDKNPSYYGKVFAGSVGCHSSLGNTEILSCLQAVDVEKIVSKTSWG